MMAWEKLWQRIERHRIIYGITAALLVAMLLTVVSMALYVSSGASRLDLSRPGYEHVRTEVRKSTDDDIFSATGPMNSKVADEFQAYFTRHRTSLSQLDTFDTSALDDSQLQIAPDPQAGQ